VFPTLRPASAQRLEQRDRSLRLGRRGLVAAALGGELSATIVGTLTPVVNTTWARTIATYSYDKLGQKLTEVTNEEAGYYTPGYWQDEYDPYYGY
jgi:hypothetical protein